MEYIIYKVYFKKNNNCNLIEIGWKFDLEKKVKDFRRF